jgi:hypothetical protein
MIFEVRLYKPAPLWINQYDLGSKNPIVLYKPLILTPLKTPIINKRLFNAIHKPQCGN